MKKGLLYIVVVVVLLWSGASFAAQGITKYSAQLDLKDSIMTTVAKEEYSNLMTLNQDAKDDQEAGKTIRYTLGAQNEEILILKYKLYYLDYLTKQPQNNIFDETMQQAIHRYQTAKNMESTETINQNLIDALNGERPIYVLGKTGPEIKKYQLVLYFKDYLNTYPSGCFGKITVEAVLQYQKAKGLEQNGTLDIATQEALEQEEYAYKMGKTGDEIAAMQRILIEQGYLTGTAGGNFDQNTKKAVEKFQTEKNLPITGEMDNATRSLLEAL